MPAGSPSGLPALVPCTPLGCLICSSRSSATSPASTRSSIGRSNIVGKPMAQLLLGESCTVTIAHSRTRDLPDVVRRADIVVAAVGRAEMVRGDWIKPGATVIDVGINRVADRRRQGPAGRRRRFRRGGRSRRRDHAGARRRRADDDRHAHAQHAGRRASPRRPCRPGGTMIAALAARRGAAASPPIDAERAFAARCAADRPVDRVPQMCRPRRGHVHAAGGVGARVPQATARTRPRRSAGAPAHSFVSCDGRTAVNTGPWCEPDGKPRRLFHHRLAAQRPRLALGL